MVHWVSLMSLIQPLWLSAVSTLRAMVLTLRFSHSGRRRDTSPSSVVQTGV